MKDGSCSSMPDIKTPYINSMKMLSYDISKALLKIEWPALCNETKVFSTDIFHQSHSKQQMIYTEKLCMYGGY